MQSKLEIPGQTAKLTRAEVLKLASELERNPPDGLIRLKLAVLASFTVELLRPYLIVEAAKRGFFLVWWSGPYGQVEQQIVDPTSELYQQQPQVVVVLMRLADVASAGDGRFLALGEESAVGVQKDFQQWLERVLCTLRDRVEATVLVGNFAPPEFVGAGLADAGLPYGQRDWVREMNSAVAAVCGGISQCFVLDVEMAASELGMSNWGDERLAFLAKAPWSASALASVARVTAKAIRASRVAPKKCLVLDLDNTLWGGVVGESGVDGIALGPDYPGNVFVDFQRKILNLRDRGTLLAVASKNNEADVLEVFSNHPACLLKRSDFAAFEVHWEDKASSLIRIAKALNIGLDTLVFVDDNPVERAWVKDQLPTVTVVDLPVSPLGYWRALEDLECFDALVITKEDRTRAEMYATESQRVSMLAKAGTLDEFLESLELVVTVGLVDEVAMPRVAQLLAKTNQFNLTTRRHDEQKIRSLSQDGLGMWVRVRDRFGDVGLVGVALAESGPESWHLDSLVLSCRVIGRRIETALLALLERALWMRGVRRLTAEFVATAKNQPAADFMSKHGFSRIGTGHKWGKDLLPKIDLPESLKIENQTGLDLLY